MQEKSMDFKSCFLFFKYSMDAGITKHLYKDNLKQYNIAKYLTEPRLCLTIWSTVKSGRIVILSSSLGPSLVEGLIVCTEMLLKYLTQLRLDARPEGFLPATCWRDFPQDRLHTSFSGGTSWKRWFPAGWSWASWNRADTTGAARRVGLQRQIVGAIQREGWRWRVLCTPCFPYCPKLFGWWSLWWTEGSAQNTKAWNSEAFSWSAAWVRVSNFFFSLLEWSGMPEDNRNDTIPFPYWLQEGWREGPCTQMPTRRKESRQSRGWNTGWW